MKPAAFEPRMAFHLVSYNSYTNIGICLSCICQIHMISIKYVYVRGRDVDDVRVCQPLMPTCMMRLSVVIQRKMWLLISQCLTALVLYDVHFTSILSSLEFYRLILQLWLKGRKINCAISCCFPQSSVLEHLLFNAYMNDLSCW